MRGRIEAKLSREGISFAGIDEVGRGCLAGPVYAGCAVLNFAKLSRLKSDVKALIRDSKTLSALQRAKIIPVIQRIALEWYVTSASPREIEELGIIKATFLAMRRALSQLQTPIDLLLIDGNQQVAGYAGAQQTIIKGDNLCYSIAAASILAKEARDSYMREQADSFPDYGFDTHVGYGTKQHLAMIQAHGVCELHRRNFAPISARL